MYTSIYYSMADYYYDIENKNQPIFDPYKTYVLFDHIFKIYLNF